MSIDLSQFYQVFFDETAEHLANMESFLLELDVDNPDPEELNAIFRAAHSIKGAAGTFGFTDLAEVTHELETLLDRLRKQELALRSEMIDAFLAAGDVLKEQLAAHRDDSSCDTAEAEHICQVLRKLAHEGQPAANQVQAVSPNLSERSFYLNLKLPANRSRDTMLANLAGMGQLHVRDDGSDPSVLQVVVQTSAQEVDLLEVLAFVIPPEDIELHDVTDDVDNARGYGIFDKTPSEPAVSRAANGQEAWGLFQPVAAGNAGIAEEGDGFGLFAPVAEASPAGDGEGYGFFTPIEAPAADTPAGKSGDDGDGYGFFDPLPAAQGSLAPALVAEPAVAAPAKPPADTPAEKKRPADKQNVEASTIRVSVEKVDQLLNLVGELVITQSMLAQTASTLDPVIFEQMMQGIGQFERNTRELQEAVMSIRMIPISFVFNRFPRVVRDVASRLNKQVELRLIGENTELDKGFIEKLSDPLTHLVRNSLDHGIESTEARVAKGKPATGTLTLSAYHQGGNIVIEVRDDGGGLSREKILSKARERGMAVSDSMPDQEVWQLIFEAGFSTAAQVTDVSGRGVGMDVVRRNIQEMGGRIDIESMSGVGTTMLIRLPLTLAILDGMSIAVGASTYIIPLTFIVESLQPKTDEVKSMANRGRVLSIRGEYLPLVALHEILNEPPHVERVEDGLVIVLEADGGRIALFVDDLLGQHQVVIKNLENNYRRVPMISGATIMGDGRVALILDVSALVRAHRNN
jgi:two-component system chemotaxis sensor kinase CheA